MPKGTIRRLIRDRGFGFIKTEQEEDIFFHATEVQGVSYDSLEDVGATPGEPQAEETAQGDQD